MNEEFYFSRSYTAVWCPVCGAEEGKQCEPHGGLVYQAHDTHLYAPRPRPQKPLDRYPKR